MESLDDESPQADSMKEEKDRTESKEIGCEEESRAISRECRSE